MKLCASIQLFVTLLLSLGVTTSSFMVAKNVNVKSVNKIQPTPMTVLKALPENVEICNFKDCKRAGGGPRLEKLVNSILEEKELVDTIKVEFCECQVGLFHKTFLLLR